MGNWELSGTEIEALEIALRDAFSEEDLKRMLRLKLNQRWNEIKTGETYADRIFNLIEWVESESNVEQFIWNAAGYKSNNLKIQRFIETHVSHLIEINVEQLSTERFVELLTVLKRAPDFLSIWEIGRRVLPEKIEIHRSSEIEVFEEAEVSNWFKCLTLLRFFLRDYPEWEGRPSLFEFVRRLSESSEPSMKAELRDWLGQDEPRNLAEVNPGSGSGEGGLKAYLMLNLTPEEKSEIRVIATLYYVLPPEKPKQIPIHLDPESNQRGVLSTWKKIPKTINLFVNKAVDELDTLVNRLGSNYYNLTIELFLPHQYWNEPIDGWEVSDSLGNRPLLTYCGLVLRSQERVTNRHLKNAFSMSWHRAKRILDQASLTSVQSEIEHLSQLNRLEFDILQETLKKRIALKVTCSLPQSEREKLKLLQALLRSGVPMAIWTRDCELSTDELAQQFDQFLTPNLLCNTCDFIEAVRTQRALTFDTTTWGRHLTVLWDDFERMPISDPFQGGQRSA